MDREGPIPKMEWDSNPIKERATTSTVITFAAKLLNHPAIVSGRICYESYRLIPKLKSLRQNDWQQHLGKTMRVSVQPDGNVRRELVWATFADGLPVPLYSNFVNQ